MRNGSTTTVLAAMALFAAGAACAAPDPDDDAARWREMARADLDAVHARIVEAHPGVIDAANPGFNTWVGQGYEDAKAYLPYVVSYDTAMAVVRYYTTGFDDGHLVYSDDIREDFPILVTGWNIAWEDGRYVVHASLPDWSVPLPPVGATWTGCDGLAAEDVLQDRVGPFSSRRAGDSHRNSRMLGLWLRRPVAQDLRQCTFTTAAGEPLMLPVAYQPVTTGQFFDALAQTHDGSARAANAFDVHDRVLWVRAGNFHLREESGDRQELEAMLAGLAQVRDIDAIVFDARGNRGGDSSIGDRIFAAATGGLDYDQTDLEALPRYFAQWRVSDFLVRSTDGWIEEMTRLYGADSPRVADQVAFRDRVIAARAAGESWVEQDAGRTLTRADVVARHGHLHRFDAKVALLTDGECVSACLDFADIVLQVPGVVHVGQTTGADSVYLVGSRSRMPSGNTLVMPVKVWRNRTRGNNQALVPDVPVDLAGDEITVRRDVLRALGRP
jgi:hypothetical protein